MAQVQLSDQQLLVFGVSAAVVVDKELDWYVGAVSRTLLPFFCACVMRSLRVNRLLSGRGTTSVRFLSRACCTIPGSFRDTVESNGCIEGWTGLVEIDHEVG